VLQVLSTAVAINPRAARLLLLSIRVSHELGLVDVMVLVLLFSHPTHHATVQQVRLLPPLPRCAITGNLTALLPWRMTHHQNHHTT
jgi:hypothetical protein